jgi:hypothetical protein
MRERNPVTHDEKLAYLRELREGAGRIEEFVRSHPA